MGLLEVVKDIYDDFKGRLKNPLLGAIIVSWFLFNYDFTLILLSDIAVFEKITCLKEASSRWTSYIPIGIVLVLKFLLPWVELMIEFLNISPNDRRKGIKNKVEITELEHTKDKAELEYVISDTRSGKKSNDQFIEEIEQLKSEKNNSIESLKKIRESNQELNNSLSEMLLKNTSLAKEVREYREVQDPLLSDMKAMNASLENKLLKLDSNLKKQYQWLRSHLSNKLSRNEEILNREFSIPVFNYSDYMAVLDKIKTGGKDMEMIDFFTGINGSFHPDKALSQVYDLRSITVQEYIKYSAPNTYELTDKGKFLWLFSLDLDKKMVLFDFREFLDNFII
jgi:hypothetical protein